MKCRTVRSVQSLCGTAVTVDQSEAIAQCSALPQPHTNPPSRYRRRKSQPHQAGRCSGSWRAFVGRCGVSSSHVGSGCNGAGELGAARGGRCWGRRGRVWIRVPRLRLALWWNFLPDITVRSVWVRRICIGIARGATIAILFACLDALDRNAHLREPFLEPIPSAMTNDILASSWVVHRELVACSAPRDEHSTDQGYAFKPRPIGHRQHVCWSAHVHNR